MPVCLLILLAVQPAVEGASAYPPYDGPVCDQIRSSATGFFQVKQLDQRWWVIDPRGRGFYIIGTDHIRYDGHGCEALGYAPYGRAVREEYKDEEEWAEATLKRLETWGFNTLASGHSNSLRHKRLPHMEFLGFGTAFARQEALCPPGTWTGFPNVFSPHWPIFCEQRAKEQCALHRDDPWLIGYFLDNELEWYGKIWLPYGLFHEVWKLSPDHSGKQAWIAFLRKRVSGPSWMERHWGVSVSSWEALAEHAEPHVPLSDEARQMALDWVSIVAEHYFRPAAEAIRKHDPNHLILGCRFAGPSPGAWSSAGRYCDVVSFNYYPDIDVRRGVPRHVVEMFREWQADAEAPMMITEWSFPALDTELPSTNGAGMRVDDQRQRADCFGHFQRMMFRLPFMVGSDFFMYIDEPKLGIAAAFPENSNYGLVSNVDEPYELLTSAAADINADACRLHAARDAEVPPAEQWLAPWLRELPEAVESIPPAPMKFSTGNLVFEGPAEGYVWRLWLDDRLLGQFSVLIDQLTPHSCLVRPESARVTGLRRDDHVTVVDMELTASRSAGDSGAASPFRACRSSWRFWVPGRPGRSEASMPAGYLVGQCQWVENTDCEAWTLARVFHDLSPALGGSPEGDVALDMRVQRYHRAGGGWIDPGAGLGVAMWLPAEWQFYCNFQRAEGGTFHSDVHFDPYVTLVPGERYEESTGRRVFVFALQTLTREGFADATRVIERQVFPDSPKE